MRITLPSGTPAEVARPPGAPTMGLVIAPDIFGLRPVYDAMVQRFADEWGMAVAAVEPFPGLDLGPDIEPRFDAVVRKDDGRSLDDLVAAIEVLGTGRVGLLGFCMGGMYALKAAARGRFDAVVSFYGMIRVPAAWQSPTQAEPLDLLARSGASPVLAIIGEQDTYTPAADVEALEQQPTVTVVRYPEAEHGFAHDPDRPAHRPIDAADAFERAVAFLLGEA